MGVSSSCQCPQPLCAPCRAVSCCVMMLGADNTRSTSACLPPVPLPPVCPSSLHITHCPSLTHSLTIIHHSHQALLQRQRLAAEAVEQEQKEEEFHLQQAQVTSGWVGLG